MDGLGRILEASYRRFDFKRGLERDPIKFPHRYRKAEDIESAGLIASSFAYGNIKAFMPVIEAILGKMGGSPYRFLLGFDSRLHGRLFEGISYRFQKTGDITAFLCVISSVLNKYGRLYNLFKGFYKETDPDTRAALSGMVDRMLRLSGGAHGLLPSPERGGACKRLNLFLRWMVRDKDIDFGLWKDIPKNKLVIPLDTHIMSVSRCLGFTKRKSADWKTAVEITQALKRFDPEDPLKYDFVLCHTAITGGHGPLRNDIGRLIKACR